MSELIILCRPEEMDEVCRMGYRVACTGWQVGEDGRLWRSPMPKLSQCIMMAVLGGTGGERLQSDIAAECARLGIDEVVWLGENEPPAGKGYRLYRPLSTAISGGKLSEYLNGEADVIIDLLRHYFTLPSRNGEGTPVSEAQMEKFHAAARCRGFSRELGCKYLLWESGCVLYDDPESIGKKIKLLRDLGTERIILPYGSRRVKAFLRSHP